jgi:hypothetical protein
MPTKPKLRHLLISTLKESNMSTTKQAETTGTKGLHFASRTPVEQVEEGYELAPKFDRDGLIA